MSHAWGRTLRRIKATLISIFIAIAILAPAGVFALPVQCQCVLYLREVLGVDVYGDAETILPNVPTKFARVGDVVLLDYNVGHAALITKIAEPTEDKIFLTIAESNFHYCTPDVRVIALSDDHIRGIYRPLNVPNV